MPALGFLFSGDEVVVDRLAAGEEIDLGVRGMLGKDVACGLGVGLRNVAAIEDVDESVVLRTGLLGHLCEDGGEVGRDGEQRATSQRMGWAPVSAATARAASSFFSYKNQTRSPRRANSRTAAAPIPRLPPVMTTFILGSPFDTANVIQHG